MSTSEATYPLRFGDSYPVREAERMTRQMWPDAFEDFTPEPERFAVIADGEEWTDADGRGEWEEADALALAEHLGRQGYTVELAQVTDYGM